jgi:hypothetical protein
MTSLFGYRFVPHIRNLPSTPIYVFETAAVPKNQRDLLGGKIKEAQILPIGQIFCAAQPLWRQASYLPASFCANSRPIRANMTSLWPYAKSAESSARFHH